MLGILKKIFKRPALSARIILTHTGLDVHITACKSYFLEYLEFLPRGLTYYFDTAIDTARSEGNKLFLNTRLSKGDSLFIKVNIPYRESKMVLSEDTTKYNIKAHGHPIKEKDTD